jgi:DNA-binding LacI/PurR family transcriptional regulator
MALRDHPRIGAKTRRRVRALARQMGYRRDPFLSALSAYRQGAKRVASYLAFVTTGDSPEAWKMEFEIQMLEGARHEARRLGYDLVPYWLDPSISGARHTQILEARGVVGLLLAPLADPERGVDLDWNRFSTVELGRTLRRPRLHFASTNQYGGFLLLCDELRALGYRRLGLAINVESDRAIDGRWSAALLKHHSLVPAGERVKPLWNDIWNEANFLRWVDREKPDAVISWADAHCHMLEKSGRRVPRDLGFALLSLEKRYTRFRDFSGLDQNYAHVGAAGLSLLHSQCLTRSYGVPDVRLAVVVDGTWHPGSTTRPRGADR